MKYEGTQISSNELQRSRQPSGIPSVSNVVRPIVCRTAHALDTNAGCIAGATEPRQCANFVALDQFVAHTRRLLGTAHQAARGPKGKVEALCAVVYELLPPVPRAP